MVAHAAVRAGDEPGKKRERQLETLKEQVEKLEKEVQQTQETLRKFQRPYQYRGHVWLFLREPPPTARAAP